MGLEFLNAVVLLNEKQHSKLECGIGRPKIFKQYIQCEDAGKGWVGLTLTSYAITAHPYMHNRLKDH